MASILNEIGYFQFSNLVKNRVPFCLVAAGFEMPKIFGPFYDNQLEPMKIQLPVSEVVAEIEKRATPKDQGIIILTATGTDSVKLVDQLESLGYKNVYYIPGGLETLLKEKSAEES